MKQCEQSNQIEMKKFKCIINMTEKVLRTLQKMEEKGISSISDFNLSEFYCACLKSDTFFFTRIPK